MKTNKAPKGIFYKLIFGCIIIIGFGFYLSLRAEKEKTEFNNVTGKIDQKTLQISHYLTH